MKTITEFSGVLLQRAAEVQRAFRAANPEAAAPAAVEPSSTGESATPEPGESATPEPVESTASPTDEAPEEAAAAASEEGAPPADDAPAAETGAAEVAPAEPAPPVDLGTGPEAEAVGLALGMQADRLSRLMEALDVVGRRAGQVRLVRVLQGESPPQGSQKRGEFYYAVDLAPRPQSPPREGFEGRDGDRRRGPGGRDRGGRPGGPGGARGAGGPPGKGGKFSNDRPSRDGDFRAGRGELPRAGAGWTLTRAPDDRRGRPDEPGSERRDRRPPRGPRFEGRGPRPPVGAAGDRPPRGPRPERAGGQPPLAGRRGPATERAAEQREGTSVPPAAPAAGPRHAPGPARPTGAGGPRREPRSWIGRRRGGWDEPAIEPAVPDAEPPPAAASPASEPTAPPEQPPPSVAEDSPPSAGDDPTPAPTENGSE